MLTAGVETVNILSIAIQYHNIGMHTTTITVMLHIIYRVIRIIEI